MGAVDPPSHLSFHSKEESSVLLVFRILTPGFWMPMCLAKRRCLGNYISSVTQLGLCLLSGDIILSLSSGQNGKAS